MSDAYVCPECGGDMQIKAVRPPRSPRKPAQGREPGHCFMGCLSFPDCKGSLEYFGPTVEGACLAAWLVQAKRMEGSNDVDVLAGALLGTGSEG
jgi:ssDNA-binding Zn-finger/Zn-ribbon topoisomerase 1